MVEEGNVSINSRDRMIHSAFELFREHGVRGTGLREINAHSGVARGAIYHHFPGGKNELATATATYAGDQIRALLEAVAAEGDPVATLRAFVAGWEEHVRSHEFRAGCTVVAIANESSSESTAGQAAAQAFTTWASVFAESLQQAGVPADRASRLGMTIVSAVEGAVILARAQLVTTALMDVGQELEALMTDALARE
jgi:TetR/AcrR family transcriptional repressor of lmrAB and yxaGH operons